MGRIGGAFFRESRAFELLQQAPQVHRVVVNHIARPLPCQFLPLEAIDRIDERVTVEMLVKAAKNCKRCSLMFLDSEEDHHDPKKTLRWP
jgi:hypothetical protein